MKYLDTNNDKAAIETTKWNDFTLGQLNNQLDILYSRYHYAISVENHQLAQFMIGGIHKLQEIINNRVSIKHK